MRAVRHVPWALAACAVSACATTAYQGPARPRVESATIASVNTVIEEIDGNEVEPIRTRRLQFSLPPGPHVVWLRLHKVSPWFGTPTLTSGHTEICLDAKAGADYLMKGAVDDGVSKWKLIVVENGVTEVGTDCNRDRLFPGAPSAAPPSASALAPAAGAPPPAGDETKPISLALPPPSPPPLPVSGVRDVVARWRGRPLWRPPALPLLDLMFNVGGGFDTDPRDLLNLPEGPGMHAASGITASAGLMLTPLWFFSDGLGLGAGSDLGLKYDRTVAPDASLSFWRMPVTATVHTLVRTHDDWFVLLAGGLENHLIARAIGTGTASNVDRSFNSGWGWVARVGAYRRLSDILAMTMGLGYSHLDYDGADASSINGWFGLQASIRRQVRESDVPAPD